jgi:integrase/recombinase XerD
MKRAKLLNEPEFNRLAAVNDSPRHAHPEMALSFYAGLEACEMAALRIGDVLDA